MLVVNKLWLLRDIQLAVDIINDSLYYSPVSVEDFTDTSLYGVKDDDALVCCAMVLHQGHRAYLDYLCVKLHYRGRGISVQLLDFIAQDLQSLGVTKVHACVNGTNEAAAKLPLHYHAKVGFPYMNVLVNLEEYHGK